MKGCYFMRTYRTEWAWFEHEWEMFSFWVAVFSLKAGGECDTLITWTIDSSRTWFPCIISCLWGLLSTFPSRSVRSLDPTDNYPANPEYTINVTVMTLITWTVWLGVRAAAANIVSVKLSSDLYLQPVFVSYVLFLTPPPDPHFYLLLGETKIVCHWIYHDVLF